MKAKKFLLMFLLLFSLVACSSFAFEVVTPAPVAPTFTPWAAGTQTALAAQSSTPTPLFSTFPSSTPPSSDKPSDFSPVLYGGKFDQATSFLLLGGVSRDLWLSPEESIARFAGEATYSLHNMEYVDKYFLWGKAPEFSPTCKAYWVGTDADPGETGFVATLDGWAVTKYEVLELTSAEDTLYHQAVRDWLRSQGVANPVSGVVRIFRVDLEDDGVDEVFVSATHLDASQHTTKAGDYSIVLMRKLVGSDVVTTLVVGDVYDSQEAQITYPHTYSLANFIDLNQDGTMEVIVDVTRWEGGGALVYEAAGQTIREVLRTLC